MSRLLLIFWVWLWSASTMVLAQDFHALARIIPEQSRLTERSGGVELRMTLSQAVPFRIFTLEAPRRVVMDFNEVDFSSLAGNDLGASENVTGYRAGPISSGWSRLVMEIEQPMAVEVAGLTETADGLASVFVRLVPTSAEEFAMNAGSRPLPQEQVAAAQNRISQPVQRQVGDRPLIVVLDPGHGGIDPGAERGGAVEATLMLTFARELKEVLLRTEKFQVVMTRDSDVFVPLEARVSIARRAGADLFLSLHADALVEGRASGSTIYTLSERASDIASQKLAERHDRSDLLAGVDLSNQDDVIAGVLMDMARAETEPRSDKLADALVVGLSRTVGMHKRPRLTAGFSVLKAPDIPSVLLELGFLSSERDREKLTNPEWRAQAAIGIRDALIDWSITDAADALLLRN